MAFNETETEYQDNTHRDTEQFNGTATVSPVVITVATGRPIRLTETYVPTKGPNANLIGAVLLVSWDGINFMSYPRGTSEMWPGKGHGSNKSSITVKAHTGTVKYEIKVVS